MALSRKASGQTRKNANTKQKCVLVLGAGISGATGARRLSEAGCRVHLAENQPSFWSM
ncbi:MAG: NAD(P)-binding protein [Planctomycetota bacterium]